jgi:hypothetical protein
MKLMNRFYSLLALLLVGSTSLQAQDTDPFPVLNYRLYSSNVVFTAQVKQNNEVVTDALVAVFCGNEIRGKGRVGAGTHSDIVFLTVHGDYEGEYQYLHFKVYTGGKIFTYNPNPSIDWEDCYLYDDQRVGSVSNPYIIDITPVSLANDADNTTTLTTWEDKTCDVVLTGRTLYKDGDWNTLCLPFNVTIAGSALDGDNVVAKVLNTTSELADGVLTLNFSNAPDEIPAGTPFIIKWDKSGDDLVNPVFTNVTIDKTNREVEFTGGTFRGNYAPLEITADNRNDILLLSSGNRLGYAKTDRTIANGKALGACRAYFDIPAGSGAQAARQFTLNFGDEEETTSLSEELRVKSEEFATATVWYALDGRKLNSKPTTKGLYIVNGKMVVIK